MNLAKSIAIMLLGLAGLVYMWTGLETLNLARGPACHGPDGAFVRLVDSTDAVRVVVQAAAGCVATDAVAGDAEAAGTGLVVGAGGALPETYEWSATGYELARESWAGRLLAGGRFAVLGALVFLVAVGALAWREYETEPA